MESIAAFSLAAAVINVVDFGLKTVSKCREIQKQGASNENVDFEKTSQTLSDATKILEKTLQNSKFTKNSPEESTERQLQGLSEECGKAADELLNELRRLGVDDRHSTTKAVRQITRNFLKKNKIAELQTRLERYRGDLETSLLLNLRQSFDCSAIQRTEEFSKLDKHVQHVINSLSDNRTAIEQLTVSEAERTRQHISRELESFEQRRYDKNFHKQYLESLYFPELYVRQEQVPSVYKDTYDWIFGGHAVADKSWDDFITWLESGQDIYWINGKPGAGKSTLINYVVSHDRTLQALEAWAPRRQLIMPTYFAWFAGSSKQKSVLGLLRSLVYQLLSGCPELLGLLKTRQVPVWTEQRLHSTLISLLTQEVIPVDICIFIDGLDEFDGPQNIISDLVTSLPRRRTVKACVSSRPSHVFEDAFSKVPSLRLQDFTFGSIQNFVKGKLLKHSRAQRLISSYHKAFHKMMDLIVTKAEGVFLWVSIVVRNVEEGLDNGDTIEELHRWIAALPEELEGLYKTMIRRIKKEYRKEAAWIFRAVLSKATVHLPILVLMEQRRKGGNRSSCFQPLSLPDLIDCCEDMNARLLSRTAGLLQKTRHTSRSTPHLLPPWSLDVAKGYYYATTSFGWIHRTAQEYLTQSVSGQDFLNSGNVNDRDLLLSIINGSLDSLSSIHHSLPPGLPHLTTLISVSFEIEQIFRLFRDFETRLGYAPIDAFKEVAKSPVWEYTPDNPQLAGSYTLSHWNLNDFGINFRLNALASCEGLEVLLSNELDLDERAIVQQQSNKFTGLKHLATKKGREECQFVYVKPSARAYTEELGHLYTHRGLGNLLPHHALREQSSAQPAEAYKNDGQASFTRVCDCTDHQDSLEESYFLSCASDFSQWVEPERYRNLAAKLLRAGTANPNLRYVIAKSDSTWKTFQSAWHNFLDKIACEPVKIPKSSQAELTQLLKLSKIFLEEGADVNALMFTDEMPCLQRIMIHRRFPSHMRPKVIASVLPGLGKIFSVEPGFAEVEQLLKYAGAENVRQITAIGNEKAEAVAVDKTDSDELVPLLERWEETGHETDRRRLEQSLRAVFDKIKALKGVNQSPFPDCSTLRIANCPCTSL